MTNQFPVFTDHDQIFKELLTTFFVEFLALFFPKVLEYLDQDSLVFMDKEIFTDIVAGDELEADLVVKARWRGREAFFLIHVESQAQHKYNQNFAERMFRYYIWLYEKYRLPIYPIALLSFDSPRKAQPDSFQIAFPDFDALTFNYRVIQLNRLNWRDFVNQANPVASALMAKMQIAKKDRPRVKAECLRLLLTLRLNPAKMRLIAGFVDTYLRLTATEQQQFRQTLNTIAPESEEIIMPLMTNSEELGWQRGLQEGLQKGLLEGHQEGRQEGLQEGRQEGIQTLTLRLLERRVGALDAATRTHIAALPLPQLEDLSVALLDFTAPADLENWFERQVAH